MNRSWTGWFAPWRIVRLSQRRCQPAMRAGSGAIVFPRILLPKKKKIKAVFVQKHGQKAMESELQDLPRSCRRPDRGEPVCGFGGIGRVSFRIFQQCEREGGKGNHSFRLCAQQTCAQCAFLFLFTNFSFDLSCLCRSQVLQGSRRGRRPHPVHSLLDIRTH